jgi:hypothetical protein
MHQSVLRIWWWGFMLCCPSRIITVLYFPPYIFLTLTTKLLKQEKIIVMVWTTGRTVTRTFIMNGMFISIYKTDKAEKQKCVVK